MKQTIKCLIAAFAAMLMSVAAFAQVTTSALGGRVVDANGEPVIGVAVIATHTPSGTVYGVTTNEAGRYTINGMRSGGPYSVEFTCLGYQTVTYTDLTLQLAETFSWDQEGFVACDAQFNRVKIKSPAYVMAHYARNNNVITRWHLIDVILKGEMDEFLIYASDYKDQIEYVKTLMDEFTVLMDDCALITRNLRKLERAEAAEIIKKFHKLIQNIMFMNLDRQVSGREYTYGWDTYKWERTLEYFTEFLVQKGRD